MMEGDTAPGPGYKYKKYQQIHRKWRLSLECKYQTNKY